MIVTSQNVPELMTIFNTQLKEFFMLKFNGMKPKKKLPKKTSSAWIIEKFSQ